jgi:hypothetical protein
MECASTSLPIQLLNYHFTVLSDSGSGVVGTNLRPQDAQPGKRTDMPEARKSKDAAIGRQKTHLFNLDCTS